MKKTNKPEISVNVSESSRSDRNTVGYVAETVYGVVHLLDILRNSEQFNKLTDALTQMAVPYGDNTDDSTLR